MTEPINELPPLQERPLVTFALFAYNQEKYIREAVEGAFAQTYEPLEIILSDDCSTDRTFEIMQEMAAGYRGRHKIITSQNPRNLGLVDHVCAVTKLIQGKFVVLGAGDDISKPERVSCVADHWNQKCSAVFSACDLIDSQGMLLQNNWTPNADARDRFPWLKIFSTFNFVYGASSSYATDVLKQLPAAGKKIFSEDTPLNLIIQITGGNVVFCKKSLVEYRVHESTLSNSIKIKPTIRSVLDSERRRPAQIKRSLDILIYLRDKIISSMSKGDLIDKASLDWEIAFCKLRLQWYSGSAIKRLFMIFNSPRKGKKWLGVRLFGVNSYALLKVLSIAALPSNSALKE